MNNLNKEFLKLNEEAKELEKIILNNLKEILGE